MCCSWPCSLYHCISCYCITAGRRSVVGSSTPGTHIAPGLISRCKTNNQRIPAAGLPRLMKLYHMFIRSDGTDHALSCMFSIYFQSVRCFIVMQ
jgi:hypothetical protein